MSGQLYEVWLSMALGQGARTDEILSVFSSAEEIYGSDRRQRLISGAFTKARLDRLESTKLTDAENAVRLCEKNGWKIYTYRDKGYPERLRQLADMPLVLYVSGDISCLDGSLAVAVVGTRNPTYESIKIARQFSGEMAQSGAVIISGGALGIDSAAHEGAINAGGKTICVLGCGLGTGYLVSNEALRKDISQNGAVITEYPPFFAASRSTFPVRNRIISGLSHGVLVVEAGEKSGSLITARCAVEQGRDVFAVPGSILSSAYTGTNKLIKDGAYAAMSAQDITGPLGEIYGMRAAKPAAEKPESRAKTIPPSLKGEALIVYKALGKTPLHPDEIGVICNLSPSKVMTALMELELSGYAEQTEGKNYILS